MIANLSKNKILIIIISVLLLTLLIISIIGISKMPSVANYKYRGDDYYVLVRKVRSHTGIDVWILSDDYVHRDVNGFLEVEESFDIDFLYIRTQDPINPFERISKKTLTVYTVSNMRVYYVRIRDIDYIIPKDARVVEVIKIGE